jgi:hypothetical protein
MGLLMHRHIIKQEEDRKKAKIAKSEEVVEQVQEAQEPEIEVEVEKEDSPKKSKKSKKGE